MSEMLGGEYVWQHLTVSVVALVALGVLLRKVLGFFSTRGTAPPAAGAPHTAGPSCSHCASGTAASKRARA